MCIFKICISFIRWECLSIEGRLIVYTILEAVLIYWMVTCVRLRVINTCVTLYVFQIIHRPTEFNMIFTVNMTCKQYGIP